MAAGADSIDDMDLLRDGAMETVFSGVRAPSTLGSHLRSYSWGNVRQLDKAHRGFMAALAEDGRLLPGAETLAFIDIDSTQQRVYGYQKEGAAFGHAKVQGKSLLLRGLNPLISVISTPLAAPVLGPVRLRGGNAASARGAAGLAAEAIGTARECGCTGTIVVRFDSAYYNARRDQHDPPQRRVLLRHRPDELQHPGRDRPHPRRRLDRHRVPAGHLGRPALLLGLRRRGRRDRVHRVRVEARNSRSPPG